MRGETFLSLSVCAIGATLPLLWIGSSIEDPSWTDIPRLTMIGAIIASPFAFVGGTSWLVRRDARASRVSAIVACFVGMTGLCGWIYVMQDREGGAFMVIAFLFVPITQLLMWLFGALVSGCHRSPPLVDQQRPPD